MSRKRGGWGRGVLEAFTIVCDGSGGVNYGEWVKVRVVVVR